MCIGMCGDMCTAIAQSPCHHCCTHCTPNVKASLIHQSLADIEAEPRYLASSTCSQHITACMHARMHMYARTHTHAHLAPLNVTMDKQAHEHKCITCTKGCTHGGTGLCPHVEHRKWPMYGLYIVMAYIVMAYIFLWPI